MSAAMKYEIKGHFGDYSVLYGPGYPRSDFVRYWCLTLWGAKRVIRRHKRRLQAGKIKPGNEYGIVYTEELLSRQDVEQRIRDLERELGMS